MREIDTPARSVSLATPPRPVHDGPLVLEPAPALEPALRIALGHRTGASFRVKAAGLQIVSVTRLPDGRIFDAVVPRFQRAAIAFSGRKMNRMFVLEPADRPNWYEFRGFWIRGDYEAVEKVNDPRRAGERFRAFQRDRVAAGPPRG